MQWISEIGNEKQVWYSQELIDSIMKVCDKAINFCKTCSLTADQVIDCAYCEDYGRASLGEQIKKIIEEDNNEY